VRTETLTFPVYTFAELSEQAQDIAREEIGVWLEVDVSEAIDSMHKLAECFNSRLINWEIDPADSQPCGAPHFQVADLSAEELEQRLAELGSFNPKTGKGLGDCVLTGVYTDEEALDGLRLSWRKGTRDLPTLLAAAWKSLVRSVHADYEQRHSVAGVTEACAANELEFLSSGKLYYPADFT
jgi:hypothetical protein